MKKLNWLLALMIVAGIAAVPVSCKNKKSETKTEENKDANAPVVISSDESLRNNVGNVIKSYDGVQADVKDGVVTLRGNIKQEDLQTLIMKVQELKPKKVENQLVIKS